MEELTALAALADALMERLRTEGAPAGTWLIEISSARSALRLAQDRAAALRDQLDSALADLVGAEQQVDLLLQRLQAALIRGHEQAPS
jgi:hypothetical protein